jgi:hypothetical protein
MNKPVIFLILILEVFSACESDNSFVIDPNKQSRLTLDDFISKVEIINLETTRESLIKSITKAEFFSEMWFVKDLYEGVFVFDKSGDFLFRVGAKGRGPGEYLYISDFNINRFTSNIELLTNNGNIIIYNLEGDYLGTIHNPSLEVSHFMIVDDDLILFSHQSLNTVVTLFSRKDERVIKELIVTPENFERRRPLYLESPPFYKAGEETKIHYGYSNEIYRLVGKGLVHDLTLDFGEYNFSFYDYDWTLSYDKDYYIDLLWQQEKVVFGFENHFESKKYLFKTFYFNSDLKALIIEKETEEYSIVPVIEDLYKVFRNASHWSDLAPAEESGTRIKTILNWNSDDNYLLMSIQTGRKERYINPGALDSQNRKIYDSISLADNPVLVKCYLKDD